MVVTISTTLQSLTRYSEVVTDAYSVEEATLTGHGEVIRVLTNQRPVVVALPTDVSTRVVVHREVGDGQREVVRVDRVIAVVFMRRIEAAASPTVVDRRRIL